jgi:hypothetical protein
MSKPDIDLALIYAGRSLHTSILESHNPQMAFMDEWGYEPFSGVMISVGPAKGSVKSDL